MSSHLPVHVPVGGQNDVLFDNGYFKIKGHKNDLKAYVNDAWLHQPPGGLGVKPTKSKTMLPSKCGETRDVPTRSFLVLKAWIIWRARQTDGFLESSASRQRRFDEEAEDLLAHIKRIQPQADGLLGNAHATTLLREWAPDVASRL